MALKGYLKTDAEQGVLTQHQCDELGGENMLLCIAMEDTLVINI